MPEGDTILRAANRMRPVLEGVVPDEIVTPQPRHARDRWPERLRGRAVTRVDTHGKHLFLRFEGDLVLHSHLRMTGAWAVYRHGARWRRAPRRAWLVMRARGHAVDAFDERRFLARLRADDPTRGIGDALLDQRIVAGLGNIWKAEGCWGAAIDPWRTVRDVSDEEALAVVADARPRMLAAAEAPRRHGTDRHVYDRAGRPCPRCGA